MASWANMGITITTVLAFTQTIWLPLEERLLGPIKTSGKTKFLMEKERKEQTNQPVG
jgi:hypothetical protein